MKRFHIVLTVLDDGLQSFLEWVLHDLAHLPVREPVVLLERQLEVSQDAVQSEVLGRVSLNNQVLRETEEVDDVHVEAERSVAVNRESAIAVGLRELGLVLNSRAGEDPR